MALIPVTVRVETWPSHADPSCGWCSPSVVLDICLDHSLNIWHLQKVTSVLFLFKQQCDFFQLFERKKNKAGNNYNMICSRIKSFSKLISFSFCVLDAADAAHLSLLQLFFSPLLPCAWTWLVGSMFSCYCSRCFYGEWFNFTRFVAFSCCACIMASMQIVERESHKAGGVN